MMVLSASISPLPIAQSLQHKLCVTTFKFLPRPISLTSTPLKRWITTRRVEYTKKSEEEEEQLQLSLLNNLPPSLLKITAATVDLHDSTFLINALADLQQHTVDTVTGFLPANQSRKKLQLASRCKGRSSFKDGYSPELIILKDYLLLLYAIARSPKHRRQVVARRLVRKLLNNATQRFPSSTILLELGPYHPNSLLSLHTSQLTSTLIGKSIEIIKARLHGRMRQKYRLQMNARVREIQEQVQLNQISKVVRKLTDKPFNKVDLSFIMNKEGTLVDSPRAVHAIINKHFSEWHAPPPDMDPAAISLHQDPYFLDTIMTGDSPQFLHPDSRIPIDLQQLILNSLRRPLGAEASVEMQEAVSGPIPLQTFLAAVKGQPRGKAPGPSGLTANMVKSWPESILTLAHSILQVLWDRGTLPGWWGDRLLCLVPKSALEFSLDNLRPISLFEVLRKTWLGIISRRITAVWDKYSLLSSSQHGFRSRHGTETALLQFLAMAESAGPEGAYFFTKWDIKRAFDSIAQKLKQLSLMRMGVTGKPLQTIMSLDEVGRAFPWTPYMMQKVSKTNTSPQKRITHLIRNSSTMGFRPQRGIGQGDTLSTYFSLERCI
jgi:hypothetical protein